MTYPGSDGEGQWGLKQVLGSEFGVLFFLQFKKDQERCERNNNQAKKQNKTHELNEQKDEKKKGGKERRREKPGGVWCW